MPLATPLSSYPVAQRPTSTGFALLLLALPCAWSRGKTTPLASILPELLGNTITLLPSNLPDQPNHIAHFQPGPDQLQVPAQVNQALVTLLSTYPLGSPSGGFTYTFDPALGTLTRSSNSFGPSFAERALTTGARQVELWLRLPARRLRHLRGPQSQTAGRDGRRHQPIGVTFYVRAHRLLQPRLRPTGPARRLEPHAPVRRRPDQGRSRSRSRHRHVRRLRHLRRVGSPRHRRGRALRARQARCERPGASRAAGHLARPDRARLRRRRIQTNSSTRLSGAASGLGDIVVRGKYAFTEANPVGLAAAVEARLPTGTNPTCWGPAASRRRSSPSPRSTAGRCRRT